MSVKNKSLPFEVVWDGDRWTDWQCSVMSQRIEPARRLISAELQAWGIDTDDTVPPRAYHRRLYSEDDNQSGAVVDAESYWVSVRKAHINGDVAAAVRYLAAMNIHEIGHIRRAAQFPWGSLDECLATEAVALLLRDTLAERSSNTITRRTKGINELGEVAMHEMQERFITAIAGGYSDEVYNSWFAPGGAQPGYILASWCGQRLLAQGAAMSDLLVLPAHVIVEVE